MNTAMTSLEGRQARLDDGRGITAPATESTSPDERRSGPMQAASFTVAGVMLAVGIAMLALGLTTHVTLIPRLAETAVGLVVAGGALALLRSAWKGELDSPAVAPAAGLTLLGSLVYLGTAMPPFNHGLVGRPTATLQFVSVMVALVAGTAAFALNPKDPPPEGGGRRPWAQVLMAPDGLVLVVGTILLGMGLGEVDKIAPLMPPKWDWTSFLGLTIPGMLLLFILRGAVKQLSPSERVLGRRATGLWIVLGWEILLVLGLSVMLYGAINNLTLGANGFQTGFKGSSGGLALWAGAAAILVFIRGPVERGLIPLPDRRWYPVGRELLYGGAAILFIVGERAVITGKAPALVVGGAFPAALLIVLAALFLLVPIRLAVKRDELGLPEPTGAPA